MIELSASSLQAWTRCRRLWALRKYYNYEGPPSIWAAIGKSVHETIRLTSEDERPLESIFREQFRKSTKGIPADGLPLTRLKSGMLCSLGQIDWSSFNQTHTPQHELYFSKILGDVNFRGYIDCLTSDNTIMEWKTTGRKELPMPEHLEQAGIYQEMIGANKVTLVYFTWRDGQIKIYEVSNRQSYVPKIEQAGEEIAACVKRGRFEKTGDCKNCWVRIECQKRTWP